MRCGFRAARGRRLLNHRLRRLGTLWRGLQMFEWLLATNRARVENNARAAQRLIQRGNANLDRTSRLRVWRARPAVLHGLVRSR